MRIEEIVNVLDGRILTGHIGLEREVESAFASDLMSDVLTVDQNKTLLITGLANLQSIRTAEISDIGQIVIARDKEVSKEMLDLATQSDIVILQSKYSVFKVSGLLYNAGIMPLY